MPPRGAAALLAWLGAGLGCRAQQSDSGGLNGKIIGLGTGYVRAATPCLPLPPPSPQRPQTPTPLWLRRAGRTTAS